MIGSTSQFIGDIGALLCSQASYGSPSEELCGSLKKTPEQRSKLPKWLMKCITPSQKHQEMQSRKIRAFECVFSFSCTKSEVESSGKQTPKSGEISVPSAKAETKRVFVCTEVYAAKACRTSELGTCDSEEFRTEQFLDRFSATLSWMGGKKREKHIGGPGEFGRSCCNGSFSSLSRGFHGFEVDCA